MAAHGSTDQSLNAFHSLLKGRLNQRRDVRVRYRAPFYLLWDEQATEAKYVKAVSCDVSEHGISVEASRSVATGTRLSLRSESGALFGGAVVRHSIKRGSIYVLGLEFGYSLLDDARELVREVYSSPGLR